MPVREADTSHKFSRSKKVTMSPQPKVKQFGKNFRIIPQINDLSVIESKNDDNDQKSLNNSFKNECDHLDFLKSPDIR